ncbi:GspJ family type II secretion system protein [Phycisphaeraceae bacterium D3-23]
MHKPRRTTRARRSGFTLLEMILAVAVTAIISVSMFVSLQVAFDTREKAEDQLAGRRSARVVLDRVAIDLEGMLQPTGRIASEFIGTDTRMGAGRDADTIAFVTSAIALPTENAVGDMRAIELTLVPDPNELGTNMLVRLVTDNLLVSTTPDPTPQVLARGVVSFNARYFDGGDWLDAWESIEQDDTLPTAIEITLTIRPQRQDIDDSDGPEEHDLVIVRIIHPHTAPLPQTTTTDDRFSF